MPPLKTAKVQTADQSWTLYNEAVGEHYHSVGEGALRETLEKHIRPALRYTNALAKPAIRILDICFGLGYNTLCTFSELEALGFAGTVEIISPELDRELIASLHTLEYPPELAAQLPILNALRTNGRYETERALITLLITDARELVRGGAGEFDIVYQDPFSLHKNPSLWSVEYFCDIYRLLKTDGILTTYSASNVVRANMRACGLTLYAHPFYAASNLRRGTIAAKTPIKALECLRV